MKIAKSASTKSVLIFAAGLVPALLFLNDAAAQFGYSLPKDDFVWNWGDIERSSGFEDFSIRGNDGHFSCTLNGKLRLGSRLSRTDVQQLETALQTSIDFVRDAANAMYSLEQQRELDWATLACKTPTPEEVSAEERVEREDRAREKAMREVEKRRARQQREQSGTR